MTSPNFQLTKWYLDITTDRGECFIGYSARIRWKKISLSYRGFILLDRKGAIHKNSSFRLSQLPLMANESLTWTTSFGTGVWQKTEGARREMLLDAETGSIDWNCVLPKAKASFKMADETVIQGLGYAEKMELTLPPWEIPITTLYWGRYLSPSNTLIWIEWKGPVPKMLVFLNGEKYTEGVVNNKQIRFGSYTLTMTTHATLRSGSIGTTVFSKFKKIMALFPLSISRLEENKWTGKATFFHAGEVIDDGRYIHEEVNWK